MLQAHPSAYVSFLTRSSLRSQCYYCSRSLMCIAPAKPSTSITTWLLGRASTTDSLARLIKSAREGLFQSADVLSAACVDRGCQQRCCAPALWHKHAAFRTEALPLQKGTLAVKSLPTWSARVQLLRLNMRLTSLPLTPRQELVKVTGKKVSGKRQHRRSHEPY